MKNLLLATFLIFVCATSLFANSKDIDSSSFHEQVIEKVTVYTEGTNIHALITMYNGYEFSVVGSFDPWVGESDCYIYFAESFLTPGFCPEIYAPRYRKHINLCYNDIVYYIVPTKKTKKLLLEVIDITTLYGYLWNSYEVTLSDGSSWDLYSEPVDWSVGDKVLLTTCDGKQRMINMDVPSYICDEKSGQSYDPREIKVTYIER